MTVVDRHRQRVFLPRSGPTQFWERIRVNFAGDDPVRWKALVMFALRVECGWPLEMVGHAFGHTKGHVLRTLRQLGEDLRERFLPSGEWRHFTDASHETNRPPRRTSESPSSSKPRDRDMIELRRLPIDRLQPAPYNPRIVLQPGMPGYRRLERSLAEFDLVQPIVWNERTGHVVSGHQRLEILKHRGDEEVDVSVVSLSLEREKALNVVLNNQQVGGDWEMDKLTDLVAELDELVDFDATLTGFDDDDVRALLMEPADDPATDDAEREATHVRVTLEVPPENWESVRPALDALLTEHDLAIHVKLPG
ncbi:MAG: ParB N-terminal domain-containing protein [Planctomycetaceae bacterium]